MKNRYKLIFFLLISCVSFVSCDELLDVTPDEVLLEEDYLGTDGVEARSALFGILSQLQDVSKQYLVLGELRADLMDVTDKSVDELRQLNNHEVAAGNSLTDPTELFSIINNCNFALQGIDTLAHDNELINVYASILRVRTWAHLQIGINAGAVPYITEPISSVEDLEKEYPLLTLDQALEKMIEALIPFQNVENVTTYENSLSNEIYRLIPDKDILLGDLYLWAKDYAMAATSYKLFLDSHISGGGNTYNLTSQYYISFASNTSSSGTVNWISIFDEDVATSEVINYIPFTLQYRQPNTAYALVEDYQVKPSMAIVENWMSQVRLAVDLTTAFVDYRYYLSTTNDGEGLAIRKYQYDYMILCRAANVWLKYAEAINRAGYPLHALYVLNQGPKDVPTAIGAPRFIENAESFLNFTQTKYYTVSSGVSSKGNLGVRGRAGLQPQVIYDAASQADSIYQVEMFILNESALETAFEGNRWGDLVRISLRNDDSSILAEAVSGKFTASGSPLAESVKAKLLDRDNWYLDMDIPSNVITVTE
ncbi:hypothetical protein [Mangrovibacterium sp.]|uniref:hypothetical protein n=1 Tax=Mangrovibacterium sp. TaxID=1961364 RepID=UPI003566D0B3